MQTEDDWIQDRLDKIHSIRIAKEEVSAVANSIFNEYMDKDEIYEFEKFANNLSKQTGISAETITKGLNQLVKEHRLIVAESPQTKKTFIRKFQL